MSEAKSERAKMTARLRYDVLRAGNFRCVGCGRTSIDDGVVLHVDHIVPIAKGGETKIENLQVLCKDCNFGKSTKDFVPIELAPDLVGKFFHTFQEDGNFVWQGIVIKRLSPDMFRCRLFEWVMGTASDEIDVRYKDMIGWVFYDTQIEWLNAYADGIRFLHPERQYRSYFKDELEDYNGMLKRL